MICLDCHNGKIMFYAELLFKKYKLATGVELIYILICFKTFSVLY